MRYPDAHIVVISKGENVFVWEWQGGLIAHVSREFLYSSTDPQPGDIFSFGPFDLLVIRYDFVSSSYWVTRANLKGWLIYYRIEFEKRWFYFYQWIIWRLIIWGLGDRVEGACLSWRDIYVLDGLAGLVGLKTRAEIERENEQRMEVFLRDFEL